MRKEQSVDLIARKTPTIIFNTHTHTDDVEKRKVFSFHLTKCQIAPLLSLPSLSFRYCLLLQFKPISSRSFHRIEVDSIINLLSNFRLNNILIFFFFLTNMFPFF